MDQEPNSAPTNNTASENPPTFVMNKINQPAAAGKPVQPANTASFSTGIKNFYRENRVYVWAIVLGLAIIGVLAYFALRKAPIEPPKEAKVNLSVDVPDGIPAGGEAIYKIKVANEDPEKLVEMSLELTYPGGIEYINSIPKSDNLSGTLFKVPDLITGQNAVITVKARVTGNINDTKELGLKLHYRYSNSSLEFVKQSTSAVRLIASNVSLEFSGPPTTNNSQLIIYKLDYKNDSKEAIANARLKLTYPEGFSFASATPPPDSGTDTWNINSLPTGSTGNISIQGSFKSANPGESKTTSAELQILGKDGGYFTQGTASFTTAISNVPLLVSQEFNQSGSDNIIAPGNTLTFTIKYQNNASVAATGANIIATLDSKALDLSTIQADGGQVTGNTILWNASSVSNLEKLNPSDSGQVSFSVRVKDPATKDSSKNLSVISSIKIKSNEYETYFPGNEITLKISSPSSLNAALQYAGGSLPPEVGKTTTYKVRLSLTNSSNDYNNGVLTAFIPLGTGGFIVDSVNTGEALKTNFDPATGKLTWNVGALPAYTGKFSQTRVLEFSVRIIPSSSQRNSSPALVKDIQFTATDSYTNQEIKKTTTDLSTADIDDYLNGTVQ